MRADEYVLLTPEQMYAADAAAVSAGVSANDLMAAAGAAVANEIVARWARCPVVVLCGPGNNGGDGFVVARLLQDVGWPVRVGLLGELARLQASAAHHAALWNGPVEAFSPDLTEGAGLVVDAVYG